MTYSDYNIVIPHNKHSGQVATICPQCSHLRKKSKDKCLGVNLDRKVWHCNHCGWSGGIREPKSQIVYAKPEWKNRTELPDKVVKWFEGRGIRQNTLSQARITCGVEWMPKSQKEMTVIEFNYFRDGELINIKYRDAEKGFKLYKDAELIFYNIDAIKYDEECVIVEGEMDCLSFMEAGINNVVSVPNGANINSNNLTYLDNCIEYFDNKTKIYIATDNDIAGRKLRQELADRLGIERCCYIDFGDCKDANEYLLKYGIEGLHGVKAKYKDFPIEGVFTISDLKDDISDMYEVGLDCGVDTGIDGFNLRVVKGYITVVGGIPGHGKSDWIDNMAVHLKVNHGWNGAFYSPENKPTRLHISKIARKLTGKPWDGDNRLSKGDLQDVMDYLDNSFWFIKPEKDFTLESILESVRRLKQRYGIDFFVIDAWNKLEHKYDANEHKYIGESLDMLGNFCESTNVHCFLAAHPRKMAKDKDGITYLVPTMYDISGSSHFYNKCDNGITVYRDFQTNKTYVHRQKVKFSHWGSVDVSEYDYDLVSGRYYTRYLDRSNWINGKTELSKWADEIRSGISTPKTVEEDEFLF